MIEYALKDIDDNEYVLNDAAIVEPARGSLTIDSEGFAFENKVVESSSLHGAVKLGKTRIMSREIGLRFSRALGEAAVGVAAYRAAENALIAALYSAVYLVDKTHGMQTPIAISDYNLDYGPGAHKLSSDNEIAIQLLKPFWEETTASNEGVDLAIDLNEIAITNAGSVEVPPVLTFTTVVPVTQIQIYVDETKEGIQIEDDLFGEVGYFTMIADCKEGTLAIGTLDRVNSILAGTGFFRFPVGASTLIILPDGACHVEIDWHERYYL